MGLITYALRLPMILLLGRLEIPPVVRRALRFVPPAVLSAIILPDLVLADGARFAAGIVAMAIAWRTKSAFATVAGGLVTLWILQVLRY
jgi:branched-subunit amino acid transport protein